MTAYELLDRLRAAGLGGQPPVAYRALDFLVGNGFAHRIERLGAFVACTRAERAASGGLPDLPVLPHGGGDGAGGPAPRPIWPTADAAGFTVERDRGRGRGRCAPVCREAAA